MILALLIIFGEKRLFYKILNESANTELII
jgi:hypothetical protein